MSVHHPSKQALQQWLAGAGETEIDRHLSTCQRCAIKLEQLDSSSALATGDTAAGAQGRPSPASVARPPGALHDQGTGAGLGSRQIFDVVADLFAAGFETTRLLLIEDTDDDD